jgi:hypothetical protein
VGQPFFNELWSRRFHRLAQIQDGADPAKTVVTPNGAAVDRFTALGRVPSEPDEFRVEFVGRVVPIKGLKRFVRTFRIVVESIPDTRATIVWPMDENWSHWPAGYFFFFGFFVSLRMPVPFAIALTPSRVMYQGSGAKLLLNSATTRRRPPPGLLEPRAAAPRLSPHGRSIGAPPSLPARNRIPESRSTSIAPPRAPPHRSTIRSEGSVRGTRRLNSSSRSSSEHGQK